MKVEVPRTTLELAISALKSASQMTHRLAQSERRRSSAHLRQVRQWRHDADELDAAAEEIRKAMTRADRDG